MEDLQTTILIAVFIAFVAILIAGATNKIVVYFDASDFLISFMPWGSILLGRLLLNVYQHDDGVVDFNNLSGIQEFIWYASLSVSAIFLFWSIKLSITHNKNILLGLFVGIFKVLSALLGVLVLVGQVGKVLDNKSSTSEALIAILIFGIFIWLGGKLMNGEQVYLAKGWALPEDETVAV